VRGYSPRSARAHVDGATGEAVHARRNGTVSGTHLRGGVRVRLWLVARHGASTIATGASRYAPGRRRGHENTVKTKPTTHERIYAVVRKIPRGRVTTYGTVARLAGLGLHARLVGYALSALPSGTTVPWHRVINAQGRLSLERSSSGAGIAQRIRLVRE